MNINNDDSLRTNVYNFTLNNEPAVEVQYGDQLVINGAHSDPIYCLKNNGPPNYITDYNDPTSLHLDDNNYYPLISVIISKCH